ncbi:MAG: rhodanese-like domain-containing protein [Thiopseudomonas sp.]|nr:PQQ-dependent catabolism-associated CXXCW motif protein [Gammaproteobacteria bacterium]
MGRLINTAVLALVAGLLCSQASQADDLFTDEGYRATRYRSPTPLTHDYAQTLEPAGLLELQQQQPQPLLVDAYGNPWLHGRFTLQAEHRNIPGSLWLANCGEGVLSSEWEAYCRTALDKATDGNYAHPLVFYCRSDCWLGWNAARRAAGWGYTRLYWLRDGIDAWEAAGYELELSQPVPRETSPE